MRSYFKIVTSREAEMTGAGLGYGEMYGHEPRYSWDRDEADAAAERLNSAAAYDADPLAGTYSIQQRAVYDDGRFDDEGDWYAREQLGLPVTNPVT